MRWAWLSCGAEVGEAASYPVTVTNPTSRTVRVRVEIERRGLEAMGVSAEPAVLEVASGGEAHGCVRVHVGEAVPPGGIERQRVRVSIDDRATPVDALTLITVRPLARPHLLHTEAGWAEVRDKVERCDWAARILEKLCADTEAWRVPPIDPGGEFVYAADASRPLLPAVVAWKLTGREDFAEKARRFVLQLSDPDRGFPQTRRGCDRYAVKQGLLLRNAAFTYDLLAPAGMLSRGEDEQIAHTLGLFMRQWAEMHERFEGGMRPYADNTRIGNHELSVVTAAIMCALTLRDFNHLNRYLWGPGGFSEQLARGVRDDGWWFEPDPGYHLLVASFFLKIARACEPWGYNLFDFRVPAAPSRHAGVPRADQGPQTQRLCQGPQFRNARTIRDMLDGLIPLADHRAVVFANSKSDEAALGEHYEQAYARWEDPTHAWVLQHRRGSIDALLYGAAGITAAPDPRPEVAVSHYAGFHVLRSPQAPGRSRRDQLQAVLKAGSHGDGHGHFDQTDLLSIMRYGRSFYRTQAIRSWEHDEPVIGAWLKRSPSHNLIVVDRADQGYAVSKRVLLHEGRLMRAAAVQAVAPWKRPDETRTEPICARRLVVVTADYLVVADAIGPAAGAEAEGGAYTFDWLLHPVGFAGFTAGTEQELPTQARFADAGPGRFVTDCRWWKYTGTARLRFEQRFKDRPPNTDGPLCIDLHAAWPAAGEAMVGRYPRGTGDAPEDRCTVALRSTGAAARYLTVIEPHEGEPVVRSVEAASADTLEVTRTDGRVDSFRFTQLETEDAIPGLTMQQHVAGEAKEMETV